MIVRYREIYNKTLAMFLDIASDHFTINADFTGIDAVEKDLQFVFRARHDIQTQAQDVLDNGLHHLVRHDRFVRSQLS
jgi:hypothetical protein